MPKIYVVQNKDSFTATLSNTDCVTEYGFVYGKESQVTLETSGRRRVVFTKTTFDHTFSFDVSGITGDYTIRGYVVYKDKNGKEMTVYSDQVAF